MPMNNRLLRPTTGLDPDAAKYLAAVEAADGEPLEPAVRTAINGFFRDAKKLGVFSALKACCILAGARTLAGALVPVVGDAPTNVADGFVEGDFSRTAGLTGDGTSYIDSGRAADEDPQNDKHISAYITTTYAAPVANALFGNLNGSTEGSQIYIEHLTGNTFYRVNAASSFPESAAAATGLNAVVRSGSAEFSFIRSEIVSTETSASVSPTSENIWIFARNAPSPTPGAAITTATIAFYSIGTSLSLADLETAVTSLMTAIGNALNVPFDGGGSSVNVAPTVTLQPTNATASEGSTATFTSAASGSPTPTVQWQLSTDSGASWADIGGATSGSYTTPTLTAGDDGNQYRAVWSNSEGTATSNAATLSVTVAVVGSSLWILDAYPPVFHWST